MREKGLDAQNLSGPQKAAVFLLTMDEEYVSQIFKKMNDQEIKEVASVMAEIDQIPSDVLSTVMEEFVEAFESEDRLVVKGEDFLKSAIGKALERERADSIVQDIEDRKHDRPFLWSRDVDVGTLAEHIKAEHPQTIAMILAHLPADIAAQIMGSIPEELKGNVAMRIARLGQIPGDILMEVDQALRSSLARIGTSGSEAGGLQTLVDILGGVDKATEEAILETIEEANTEMASDIRGMMFVFEDLVKIDDRGMREILKKVESQQLVLALKTASEEMKQKILNNLSSRAAEMLKEDLAVMGPVRLAEVEGAQMEVVNAAKELETEGTIVLGGKGKEDVLV